VTAGSFSEQQALTGKRRIGPGGTIARVVVGIGLLLHSGNGASWWDVLVGLVAIPGAIVLVLSLRRRSAPPLRLYGPEGHLLNCGIAVGLAITLGPPAGIFYGTSMLVAAARGYAGCELLALANAVTRRNDEIACPIFAPVDALESPGRVSARKN
jgi:hypothetical protein